MPENTAIDNDPASMRPLLDPDPSNLDDLEQETQEDRARHLARLERARLVLVDDLTRKIDHILYTEWDPIGVHLIGDFDCFDEYHRYLPSIVEMLREDAALQDISDRLMVVESYMKGPDTVRRRCDVIAVLVSQYGPHAEKHPFIVTVKTDTPQEAYQSVLDLVTQTRLDAYEKKWEAVCQGYEQAVQICHAFLPRRNILVGACLNNLGYAHTMTRQLDKARAALEEAASRLKPKQFRGNRLSDLTRFNLQLYASCLNNLIAHLEHRGQRVAAVRYARALVSYSIKTHGKRFSHDARERLRRIILREQAPVTLRCAMISVEQDGCGVIGNTVMID
jgi:tetratricopeptide (TPR) repeat protein